MLIRFFFLEFGFEIEIDKNKVDKNGSICKKMVLDFWFLGFLVFIYFFRLVVWCII